MKRKSQNDDCDLPDIQKNKIVVVSAGCQQTWNPNHGEYILESIVFDLKDFMSHSQAIFVFSQGWQLCRCWTRIIWNCSWWYKNSWFTCRPYRSSVPDDRWRFSYAGSSSRSSSNYGCKLSSNTEMTDLNHEIAFIIQDSWHKYIPIFLLEIDCHGPPSNGTR